MDDPYPPALFLFFLSSLLVASVASGLLSAFVASSWWQARHHQKKDALQIPERILLYFSRYPLRLVLTLKVVYYLAFVWYVVTGILLCKHYLNANLSEESHWLFHALLYVVLGYFSVLVHLLFADKIFPVWWGSRAQQVTRIAAIPSYLLYLALYPLTMLLMRVARAWWRYYNPSATYSEQKLAATTVGLHSLIQPLIPEQQTQPMRVQIYKNAMELPTLRVRECMIPRTEIAATDKKDGIEGLRSKLMETGYSKILVYESSIDEIVGYCHSSALFRKPKSIDEILNPIPVVPETMSAADLLVLFAKEHKSIALVLDEFGGTAGLVCTEDVMEQIFGEIKDEHDDESLEEQNIAPNVYLLNARLSVHYLNQKYEWQIPEGEYETLSGYILSVYENIPDVGKVIESLPFRIKILSKTKARINLVELTIVGEEN
jgi:putative hemolysin